MRFIMALRRLSLSALLKNIPLVLSAINSLKLGISDTRTGLAIDMASISELPNASTVDGKTNISIMLKSSGYPFSIPAE